VLLPSPEVAQASICLAFVTPCLAQMMTRPLPVAHLSGAVLGALKPANLHASGVLLIFQHSPASLAAQAAMKTSAPHVQTLFKLLVSSTVGF
jgi:hypothetical protein